MIVKMLFSTLGHKFPYTGDFLWHRLPRILFWGSLLLSSSMVVLALLAPIYEYFRNPFAASIYSYLSLSCHQLLSHSFWLWGSNIGLCSRCFSLYMSYSVTGLALLLIDRKFLFLSFLNRKSTVFASLLIFPILIDGGMATITQYVSTNLLRTFTGVTAGIGLSLAGYKLQTWTTRRVENADASEKEVTVGRSI